MTNPPRLSDEQRSQALAKAAEARRRRAELKEKVKLGALSLEDVFRLAESDEVVARTKVVALLESLPGVGKVSARRAMEEVGIAESRRLKGLGDQQRRALLERFGRP
ncbi:MAG: hypothetical protein KatS3mg008_0379 [Acidimicrobiales bacterium]|nr:MAG: hypothetical protein KatS3mg008_0379 [Acidimicrobiales bacterium]